MRRGFYSATVRRLLDGFPLHKNVKYCNAAAHGLIALDKPYGVMCHPNTCDINSNSLLHATYNFAEECYELNDCKRVWLLNRIDACTSGLVLVSLTKTVSDIVKQLFAKSLVQKSYYAMVFGHPKATKGVWKDRLGITNRSGQLRAFDHGNLTAVASFRVIKKIHDAPIRTLIELNPESGRTHQLRIQCAKRNLPIIGDNTYGNFSLNRSYTALKGGEKGRLFLHMQRISLRYVLDGVSHDFQADSNQTYFNELDIPILPAPI